MLHRERPDLYRRVTCYLLDGTPVRAVGLEAPIPRSMRPKTVETGYITVSARQIQFLHVDYYPSPSESSGSQD